MKNIIKEEVEGFITEMAEQQYWTAVQKPKVMAALNQIDAPKEWKQNVLKFERIVTTAKNALGSMSWQNVMYKYGDKLFALLRDVGNPSDEYQSYGKGYEHPSYPYWKQYSELTGNAEDANVGDWLA